MTEVHFKEGDFVKKDDLLFTMDPRPLEAALNQAQANVSRDEAALGPGAGETWQKTRRRRAMRRRRRAAIAQLYEQKIISRDQAEQMRANADAIAQAVRRTGNDREHEAPRSAPAARPSKTPKCSSASPPSESPITGRTGNLTVKQGNVVMANNMELMTINQVEPIYVTFAVPEAQLASVKRYMAAGKLPVRVRSQDERVRKRPAS